MKLVIAAALALALAGGGCGYLAGYFPLFNANAGKEAAAPKKEGHAAKSEAGADKEPASGEGGQGAAEGEQKADAGGPLADTVYALDPIVTNIAMPSDVWVRFEAVIKAKETLDPEIPEQIHQDIFAFLRTMRLSELTGSSAFIDLKAELLARAKTRSAGKVEAIYIKTFLFE
jgi:flagellar protein FliL